MYLEGGSSITSPGDWRIAFYMVCSAGHPAWDLGLVHEGSRRGASIASSSDRRPRLSDYLVLLTTKSYVLNCLGMAP